MQGPAEVSSDAPRPAAAAQPTLPAAAVMRPLLLLPSRLPAAAGVYIFTHCVCYCLLTHSHKPARLLSRPCVCFVQCCRADGGGTGYDLPWTRGWSGVSDGFTPTVEPITEFGVYKMKPYGKAEGCAAWACDQFKGMFVYQFKWKLPAGGCGGGVGVLGEVKCGCCEHVVCSCGQLRRLTSYSSTTAAAAGNAFIMCEVSTRWVAFAGCSSPHRRRIEALEVRVCPPLISCVFVFVCSTCRWCLLQASSVTNASWCTTT